MAKGFDRTLDECVELMLRGESIEQCLAAHPEKAEELRPLLEVVLAAQQASAIEPRPEFKAQVEYQLTSALQQAAAVRKRGRIPLFHWQRRWATVAIAFLLVFAFGGGTIFASADSMPDEPLYPVKLATERLQLTFTPSAIDKAKLHARFADRRIQEMTNVAEGGKAEEVDVLSLRLISHLERVKLLAESKIEERAAMETPAPQEEKVEGIAPEEKGTAEQEQKVGEAAQKEAERREKLWSAAQKEEATFESFDKAAKDVKVETFAQLRQSLEEKAAKNQQLLREAWKKATPSSRPALDHAMQRSSQKYDEVLKAMREKEGGPPSW